MGEALEKRNEDVLKLLNFGPKGRNQITNFSYQRFFPLSMIIAYVPPSIFPAAPAAETSISTSPCHNPGIL
jgi:hypothetical protein